MMPVHTPTAEILHHEGSEVARIVRTLCDQAGRDEGFRFRWQVVIERLIVNKEQHWVQ